MGVVPSPLKKGIQRDIFPRLLRYLDDRQAITLVGLRRVGKTTLFFQLIDHLLTQGIPPKNIVYFSFDEEEYPIDQVLQTYEEQFLQCKFRQAGKVFLFLDEIHKIEGWAATIKRYYDLYPNLKFFLAGSASINLLRTAKESLAGRIYETALTPLNFREFLHLRGIKVPKIPASKPIFPTPPAFEEYFLNCRPSQRTLEIELNKFLLRGGLPEIANETDEAKVREYIRSSVLDRVVFRDIPATFNIDEPQILLSLLRVISQNPGLTVDYSSLASDLGRDRKTITKYLGFLELCLLVKKVYNFSRNFLTSEKKQKRFYPADTGFSTAFNGFSFSDADLLGRLAESVVQQQTKALFFWRERHSEVDFVCGSRPDFWGVEVKFQEGIRDEDLSGLRKFNQRFGLKRGILVSKKVFDCSDDLTIVPLWFFLLLPNACSEWGF